MAKDVMITMRQWNEWHELGDSCVVEELLSLKNDDPNETELWDLLDDCFNHEYCVEGGESYEDFKERFCDITSKYVIDWEE